MEISYSCGPAETEWFIMEIPLNFAGTPILGNLHIAGIEINIISFGKNEGYNDMIQFFVRKVLSIFHRFWGPTAGRDQDWRHDQFQDMDRPRVNRAGLGDGTAPG